MATSSHPSLEASYVNALPASHALYQEAQQLFPDGVTHDNRRMQPFPIYIDRADGAYKWDVDGNCYIDYWMGHGALLCGHNPPHIRDAIVEQATRGTHYGASHPLEVKWADWVRRLVPCAEMVRFTSSGTEATHMALRLSRAYTRRKKVIKFAGHFHGWHEGLGVGMAAPYDALAESGQLQEVADAVALCPPNDIEAVRTALAVGDVAAIILEPTGAHFGGIPTGPGFLEQLRHEATKAGTVLIFDEVVTGFRVAPGGAQELYGVTPDLSTFAKILSGGLPGGAVAGRTDIMSYLATKPTPEENRQLKMPHPGTFNANPLSATAGIAMLSSLADGESIRFANAQAAKLRHGMNETLAREQVAWKVYGIHSDWKLFYGAEAPPSSGEDQGVDDVPWRTLDAKHNIPSRALRQALILEGIDFNGAKGLVGTCHTDDVVEETLSAFAKAVHSVKQDGLV